MPEKQHCCEDLASKLGKPDSNVAYISPESWEQYAKAGWFPGANEPGYYTLEDRYDPRYGGRWTIVDIPMAQCPFCKVDLT